MWKVENKMFNIFIFMQAYYMQLNSDGDHKNTEEKCLPECYDWYCSDFGVLNAVIRGRGLCVVQCQTHKATACTVLERNLSHRYFIITRKQAVLMMWHTRNKTSYIICTGPSLVNQVVRLLIMRTVTFLEFTKCLCDKTFLWLYVAKCQTCSTLQR